MSEGAGDALLRASAGSPSRTGPARLRLGDCVVVPDLDRVIAPHGEVALEPKAMAVLMHLVRRAGQVVSADELIDEVWRGRPMGDNPVYRCVAQLRRALDDNPREPRYIATVPTKGYRLIATVAAADPSPAEMPDTALPPAPTPTPTPTPMLAPSPAAESESAPEPEPATESELHPGPSSRRRAIGWAVGAGLAALLVIAAIGFSARPLSPSPQATAVVVPKVQPVLAVLPLHVATKDAAERLLADSVTNLIRDRLARTPGLLVIDDDSAAFAAAAGGDLHAQAARLHARYVLVGDLRHADGGIEVAARLLDMTTGQPLWNATLSSPGDELTAIPAAIASRAVVPLGLSPAPARSSDRRIDVEAYRVYMLGRQQLRQGDDPSAVQAMELFRRATMLAPGFARAYLGLGRALMQVADNDPGPATEQRADADRALGHALDLDPQLGGAWSERARMIDDPARADAMFRKGLAMAPNDADGHVYYSQFLWMHRRLGESFAQVRQARRIKPMSPELDLREANMVMIERSDVAEHDRLIEQALAINPQMPDALAQLARSRWEYTGQFAEAATLIQRTLAVRPVWPQARALASEIYLDLGDPAAAASVLGPSPLPEAAIQLAQYRGDRAGAAAIAARAAPKNWPDLGQHAPAAHALRDEAIVSGDFSTALRLLQEASVAHAQYVPMWFRGFDLVRAHVLLLAGRRAEGLALVHSSIQLLDTHGLGRTPHWFSRELATAYLILGDDEQAITQLQYSVASGQVYNWWYLAGHDPLYARLRSNPRFQALDQAVRRHREQQQALLRGTRREAAGAHLAGAASSPTR